MRWLLFLSLAAFSWAARRLGMETIDDPAGSALVTLGCLVIGGVLSGELAHRFRAPRITGYLILGMIAGPHAVGLETVRDAELLRLFEELALGLIALTAGGEFRIAIMRRRLRPLIAITAAHTIGIAVLVSGALWALSAAIPFLGPVGTVETLAAVALCGVIAVAVSPSTTIAVIADLRARGELVETILGVTILKDLVILLLFTAVSSIAAAGIGGGSLDLSALSHVMVEIVGSLMVGAVLGVVLGSYIARVGRLVPLTVLLLALASAEMGRGLWMEQLLICMAAGFTARNLYPDAAGRFLDALEQSSTPVFIVFFALVGAGLDLRVFVGVWIPASIYVVVRLIAVWVTTRWPASAAGAGYAVVRHGWTGFVAQAGLSLGFAARLQRDFPGFGEAIAAVVVAGVVINQLIGPILWERGIIAAGENSAD